MFNNNNKLRRLLDDMEEYCIGEQTTDENVAHVHYMPDT
jgi:hypothetical protein